MAVPLATALLAACGSASSSGSIAGSGSSPAAAPKPVPYRVYAQCGIDYAQVGNRYYEATRPLSRPGTLTVTSPAKAILTRKSGRRMVLTLVPAVSARSRAGVCSEPGRGGLARRG